MEVLKKDLEKLVDEKDQEVLKLSIDETAGAVGSTATGRNEKIKQLKSDIGQLKTDILDIKSNQLNVLLLSLDINEGAVIDVHKDSKDRVSITNEKGKKYKYFTEAFDMLVLHGDVVGHPPFRTGEWDLKMPGRYILDVDLEYKSNVPGQFKKFLSVDLSDGDSRYFREEPNEERVDDQWIFDITRPNTKISIVPKAYKKITLLDKRHI